MGEDNSWNFQTCKFCPYRSNSVALTHQRSCSIGASVCVLRTPERYKCVICKFETNLKVNLKQHFRVSHEGKEDNEELGNKCNHCENCDFEAHSVLVLTKHVINCKADPFICHLKTPETYKCQYCRFETSLKVDLTGHRRVLHEGKAVNGEICKYRCKNCNFETHSALIFGNHADNCKIGINNDSVRAQGVSDTNWFECARCTYKTKHQCNLKMHILMRHTDPGDINWFKCTQCVFKTKLKQSLKMHILRKHTDPEDVRWIKCAQCTFKTKHQCNLKMHILMRHTDPGDINWFKCTQCVFKTKLKYSLNMHILRKHTDPEDVSWIKCAQCTFKTIRRNSLQRHILQKHTDPEDINWFKCTQCEFKSKLKSSLNKHISLKNHAEPEDSTWFKCTQCAFKTKTKTHNFHTMEKNGICEDINRFICAQCVFKSKLKHSFNTNILRKLTESEDVN